MNVQNCFELRKSRSFTAFYTGGDFDINSTGDLLFTTCGNIVKVLNIKNGSERFSIGDPSEECRISSFILIRNDEEIIIAYSNDIIKRYSLKNNEIILIHQFRGTHSASIQILKAHCLFGSTILATGSADYSVKVWNLEVRQCTHNFRGKTVVSALCFINNGEKLVVGYTEGQVLFFNLTEKTNKSCFQLNKHTSRITSIIPLKSESKNQFGLVIFSCDQTASIINSKTFEPLNSLSLSEVIEDAYYLGGHELEMLTVGDQGNLIVWSLKSASKVKELKISRSSLTNVTYCKANNTIVCATAEFDLIFVDFKSLRISKQFSGFNDEIYDSCFISERLNCIAVANNTPDLRIYNLASYCCHLVQGHTESILSVDSPDWDDYLFATSSKDNSVMVWRVYSGFNPEQLSQKTEDSSFVHNLAIATGHTNSVTCVKFSHLKSSHFFVSVSTDSTLKIWSLSNLKDKNETQKLSCFQTFVAHSKDINSVDVSMNDKLCVTASMDKTAKLWHIDPKTLVLGIAGTLSGHKRGVWCAKFSKSRQIVATCSGDCTIKIFSLLDKSCTQTLNGHSFAVLSILFVQNSNLLLSTDGGGLLKVWDLNHGICEKTIEAHEEKIWSIITIPPSRDDSSEDINQNEQKNNYCRYVTVGSDSELKIWEDISAEVKTQQIKQEAKRLENVQSLQNYIQQKKFAEALILTIDLAQPFQCLKIIKTMLERSDENVNLEEELIGVIHKMTQSQISILLEYASQWNTNTKHCYVSQMLLNIVLKTLPPDEFLKLPNVNDLVCGFLPYSNRHYDRLSNLRTKISHLDYVFAKMRLK